jgi:hypothetical protein
MPLGEPFVANPTDQTVPQSLAFVKENLPTV